MRFAVVRTAVPTSTTGAWQFTAPGYGTCIGAVIKVSGGLSDVTVTNGARMGLGFTDGINSRAGSFVSQNGQPTTVSRRHRSDTHCVLLMDPGGGVNGSATFSSFITDGIELNIDDPFVSAFFAEVRLLFADAGDEVKVGTLSTASGSAEVTDLGFQLSFMEGFSTFQPTAAVGADNATFSMGFAVRHPTLSIATQNSLAFFEAHGVDDGAPSARADSAYFLREIENGSVLGAVQISSIDSDGFTATQINGSGFEFYYLAVKCGNPVSLNLPRSPDVTGPFEHGGPGFAPIAAWGWNSKLSALNTNAQDGRAGAFGLWQTTGPSVQFNSSMAIEDASPTTDCQSTNDDAFPYLPDHDGGLATAIIGSVTGFTSIGLEVNYTNVDSVRCYFAMLAVGDLSVEVTPPAAVIEVRAPAAGVSAPVDVAPPAAVVSVSAPPASLSAPVEVSPPAATVEVRAVAADVDNAALGGVVRATVRADETRPGFNYLVGTVPVPDGWVETPLFLRDPLGNPVPTEQRVSEWGPTGAPRELELRGRGFSPTGGAQVYTVEDGQVDPPSEWGGFHPHINITIACDAPFTEANPSIVQFSSRLLQAGPNEGSASDVTRTVRRFGELSAGSGTRLMGYDADVTTIVGEPDIWLFDMVVQNGNVGNPGTPLGTSALHHVFFNELRLILPEGYEIVHLLKTPFTTSTKLMAPLSGPDAGKDHCMLQGDSHEYRFAVCTTAKVGRARLLLDHYGFFVAEYSSTLWSWGNPQTSWFCSAGWTVGPAAVGTFYPYGQSFDAIKNALEFGFSIGLDLTSDTGVTAWPSIPMGPYHAKGATEPGLASGQGVVGFIGDEVINAVGATSGDSPRKRLLTLMAIQMMDRDRQAGEPLGAKQGISLVGHDQLPIDPSAWSLGGCKTTSPGKFDPSNQGPFTRAGASNWRFNKAQFEGKLPPYYGDKAVYAPHSYSHMIRGMSATDALCSLKNDRIAKTYRAQLGSWGRILTLESGLGELWDSYLNPTHGAAANPDWAHKGAHQSFGSRWAGWPMRAMAGDYQTADSSRRAGYAPWITMFLAHEELAQLPTGGWHATGGDTVAGLLDTQWFNNGHGPTVDAAASSAIEFGIRGGASLGWQKGTGSTVLRALLADSCRGLYDYFWKPGWGAPHFWSPVRPESNKSLPAWTIRYPGFGDPNGTPGGIAPDCFHDDVDNYQIVPVILAGWREDPLHPQAWAMVAEVTGETAIEAQKADLWSLRTSDPLKWVSGWNAVYYWLLTYEASQQVSPPSARIQVRAPAPSVDAPVHVFPPAAVVEVSAPATPSIGDAVDPPPALVEVSAPAPAVDAPVHVSPPAATVVVSAPPPLVAAPINVTPPAAVVAISAPPAAVSGPSDVAANAAVVEVRAPAPAVDAPVEVTPPAAVVAISAPAPALTVPVEVTPPAAVVAVSAPAADVGALVGVSPPAAVVQVRAPAPAVDAPVALQAPAATVQVSAPAPAVDAPVHVAPPAARVEVRAPAPQVDAPAAVAPPAARVEIRAPAPAVSAPVEVFPPAAVVELRAPPPIPGVEVTPPAAVIEVRAPAPWDPKSAGLSARLTARQELRARLATAKR